MPHAPRKGVGLWFHWIKLILSKCVPSGLVTSKKVCYIYSKGEEVVVQARKPDPQISSNVSSYPIGFPLWASMLTSIKSSRECRPRVILSCSVWPCITLTSFLLTGSFTFRFLLLLAKKRKNQSIDFSNFQFRNQSQQLHCLDNLLSISSLLPNRDLVLKHKVNIS